MNVHTTADQASSRQLSDTAAGAALIDLAVAARTGDPTAWTALIRRYTPLVHSVTRGYGLSRCDTEDISQTVWLRLFDNLPRLRDVRALPGWIRTTTRREAFRVLAVRIRAEPVDPATLYNLHDSGHPVDHDLLTAERDQAIRTGLAELAPEHRALLVLLHADPRLSYQQVSRTLGMPVGSIGPTRARCLEKLKNTPTVHSLLRPLDQPENHAA